MILVFEVHLVPGIDGKTFLSAEIIQETSAQLMTYAEMINIGFGGMGQPDPNGNFIWIAVAERDRSWIGRSLETNENVIDFRMHEVDP